MDQGKNVIIMGAAGRDFHNFNVCFRDNPQYRVIAFTATQIPDIDGRVYPPELAGSLYPEGVPIYPEEELIPLINKHNVSEVLFAYRRDPQLCHVKSLCGDVGGSRFQVARPQGDYAQVE